MLQSVVLALLSSVLLGGVMDAAEAPVAFGVVVDRVKYKSGNTVSVRFTLRNTLKDPLVLEFASSQEYDVLISDNSGKQVFRWAAGRMFAQALHDLSVPSEKSWVVEVKLPADLAAGKYVAKAYLTTMGDPAPKYSATATFEIAQ